jgi:hypothetical protein
MMGFFVSLGMAPGYAPVAQELRAAPGSPSHLNLDRLLRKPKAGRDLLLRETLKFAENNNFTTAGWQGFDRVEQKRHLLLRAELLDRIFDFFQDAERSKISYGIIRKNSRTPKDGEGRVARGSEEIRLGTGNPAGLFRLQHSYVAVLHEIVDIAERGKAGMEVSPERSLMGLYFGGKPTRLLCLLRIHGNKSPAEGESLARTKGL